MTDETKSVLGIPYLYTTITVIFVTVNYLITLILTYAVGTYDVDDQFHNVKIIEILLLFAFYLVMWFALYKLNKKQNQSLGAAFNNKTIRKTVGILILISGLLSSTLYIPILCNVVSQIINNVNDGTVLPNTISCSIYLFELLVAIFLIIYNNKTVSPSDTNVVFGIAFLYTLITYSFYLVSNVILHRWTAKYLYIRSAFMAIVLIVLYIANRKQNQRFSSIFQNGIIRKSSGALIMIDGLISLSGGIQSLINIICMAQFNGGIIAYFNYGIDKLDIIQNVVSILIFILQIRFGKYMLKFYKNKELTE